MKISKSKIRKLIKESYQKIILEGYRKLHRQLSKEYEHGEPNPRIRGSISSKGDKDYYDTLRAILYIDYGINNQKVTYTNMGGSQFFDYKLSNGHSLNIPHHLSWPQGFSIVRETLYIAYMQKTLKTYPGIKFAVSGIPVFDAKFIMKLCALSDSDFLRLCKKTYNGPRTGSWESEIMPGYPQEYLRHYHQLSG